MVTECGSSKRPSCPSCSKPTSVCLCNRLRTPTLHNSVAVTILQHSLEKKHPLNSTRIATIGLKNVDAITVSDVNFQARFFIRSLGSISTCDMDVVKLNENRHLFDEMQSQGENDNCVGNSGFNRAEWPQICKNVPSTLDEAMLAQNGEVVSLSHSDATAVNFTIEKYGAISSFNDKCQETSLDELLASDIADDFIRKGFVVKKLGRMLLEGSNEYEESEEFEIAVPPGSVLLFPSERSVDVEAVNFEVKNLIVLDGTWAKAKRMYNENPWLRLLPHLRLDLSKRLSLYGEVRHQPRPGYLSTIESIVYAMKAVGEDSEGLDGLLDVFESMVGDQRRCKNERLRKAGRTSH